MNEDISREGSRSPVGLADGIDSIETSPGLGVLVRGVKGESVGSRRCPSKVSG